LVKLLLCREDGQTRPLFATLENFTDFIDAITAGNAGSMEDQLLPLLRNQEQLDAFRARFISSGKEIRRVTRAHSRSIYHAALKDNPDALEGLDNVNEPSKLTRALELVALAQGWGNDAIGRVHMSNTLDGYTVECTQEARRALDELCARPLYFHLTPDMAGSVYAMAIQQHGAVYCEWSAWRGLSNEVTPAKISKALELVGIDVTQMKIQFHAYEGYEIKCSPEIIEELEALHHRIKGTSSPEVRSRGSLIG
jgi:hypothetical protein